MRNLLFGFIALAVSGCATTSPRERCAQYLDTSAYDSCLFSLQEQNSAVSRMLMGAGLQMIQGSVRP